MGRTACHECAGRRLAHHVGIGSAELALDEVCWETRAYARLETQRSSPMSHVEYGFALSISQARQGSRSLDGGAPPAIAHFSRATPRLDACPCAVVHAANANATGPCASGRRLLFAPAPPALGVAAPVAAEGGSDWRILSVSGND